MSTRTEEQHDAAHPPRWRSVQPMMLVWLTLVWMALWQDISFANVVSGLLIALVISLVFPLPRLRLAERIHPGHFVVLVGRFLFDIVVASFQVAWLTIQFHKQPRSVVMAVPLRSRSDFVMTLTAEMSSLVPGTLAVEARRHTHTVYIHVLDLGDETVEVMRERVLAQEERILRALGEGLVPSPADSEGDRP
jgi:multicomponent Na+:H+ antiporter subunit E